MEQQNTKLLITGTTGFIGQALCRKLDESDYSIRALVRESSGNASFTGLSKDIEIVRGNLLDKGSLENACKNIDVVIHLAGIAHVNNVSRDEFQQSIISGSKNIIDSALANKVKKIIFVSSILAEAAEKGNDQSTAYGQAKYDVEVYLKTACTKTSSKYLILRPVNVYGSGMKGNISSMIRWIRRGTMPALPNVETKMSLLSICDLVKLIEKTIDHPRAENKCYTIAEGTPYKLLDIETAIYRALQKKIPTRRTPRMLLYAAAGTGELITRLLGVVGVSTPLSSINLRTYKNLISDSVYSNEEICSELDFEPGTSFFEQLPSIIESA